MGFHLGKQPAQIGRLHVPSSSSQKTSPIPRPAARSAVGREPGQRSGTQGVDPVISMGDVHEGNVSLRCPPLVLPARSQPRQQASTRPKRCKTRLPKR